MANNKCKIEDCLGDATSRGYCSKHWQRLYKRGTLELTRDWGIGNTHEERFWSRVIKTDSCWIWNGAKMKNGYGTITVNYRKWYVHRYSWYLTHNHEPKLFLLHSCDNPLCVNPKHLREGTAADNSRDMADRKRSPHLGERSPCAKLTDNKVREIRERVANGEKQAAIVREFQISAGVVCEIIQRKRWKHII
jgi:hypothetical protein